MLAFTGSPMRLHTAPLLFREALRVAELARVARAVRYSRAAVTAARDIIRAVWGGRVARPFLAIHYRRGDIAWTSPLLKSPAYVVKLLELVRHAEDALQFYVATEGGAQISRCDRGGCGGGGGVSQVLEPFAAAGGLRWKVCRGITPRSTV